MNDLLNSFWRFLSAKPTLHAAYDKGSKRKPTIVFLHGIAASSSTWESLLDSIDHDKYRVIALDLVGFGNSPKTEIVDYKVHEHSDYVHWTLQKLRVKTPFTIVGHSMGALIAVNYAHRWTKEITKAYLIGVPLYIDDETVTSKRAKRQTGMYFRAYDFLMKNKKFTVNGSQQLRRFLKLGDAMNVNEENWDAFEKSLRNTVQNQRTYQEIIDTKVPFHLIHGSRDEFAVKDNIDFITKEYEHVYAHNVPGADHALDKKLSQAAAEIIQSE